MDSNKNLKWGIILSYVTMFTGIVVSITYTPFLLRTLGQQQYGLYSMGQAAVSYLGLTEFGFGNAVVRYSTKYRAEGNEEKTSSMYGMFLYIYGFLAIVILIVGILICLLSEKFYTVSTGIQGYFELKVIILIMVLNMASSFVLQPYSAIITAYEKFTFAKIINLVYTILKPLVMIPLLIFGYKAISLSLVTFILTLLLSLSNYIYVKKILKIHIDFNRKNMDFSIIKEIIGYSFFIFLGSIVSQLNDNSDSIILGSIIGESAVAVYAIGYQLNTYIQQFPGMISSVFFPRVISQITKGASMDEMSNLMIKIARIQCYFVTLLLLGFALFGKEFVFLWAGDNYNDAYWIVMVLVVPAAIPSMQSIGVQILQAMNKHQFRAILYVVCAVLNVCLSIPIGILYGPIGCAACTGVCTLITSGFIINWFYEKRVGLNMKRYWKNIGNQIFKLTFMLILGILLNFFFREIGWRNLILKIMLFFVLYFVYSYKFVMNKYEKNIIPFINKI